jgi:hypothetical protein
MLCNLLLQSVRHPLLINSIGSYDYVPFVYHVCCLVHLELGMYAQPLVLCMLAVLSAWRHVCTTAIHIATIRPALDHCMIML